MCSSDLAKAAAKKAAAAAAKAVVAPAVPAALAPAAAAVPAVPAAALPVAKAAPNAAAAIAPPIATADPVAANGVKLINLPLSASSVASKAAPAPVAPAAPPANAAEALAPKLETGTLQNLGAVKPVGIYIGSGPSVDSVRQSWSLLADRNATTLGGLEPRYTTGIDANGLNYGLVAGPVKSVADAQKICRDLAAKAVTCRVGDFTGEAL